MPSILIAILMICFAGALGGTANALITDNRFLLPLPDTSNQTAILRPGFLGNIFVGMIAALISWGLYSSFGSVELFQPLPASISFTVSSFVGAMLVGVAGAKWLSNEVDKSLLRAAAVVAASAPPSPGSAQKMLASSPSKVLEIAQQIQPEKK